MLFFLVSKFFSLLQFFAVCHLVWENSLCVILLLYFIVSSFLCSPLSTLIVCSLLCNYFHVLGIQIGWHVMNCGLKWMSITFFFIFSPPGNVLQWFYVPAGIYHLYLACLSSITLFTDTATHANCILQVTLAHTPSPFLTHLHETGPSHIFTPPNLTLLKIHILFACLLTKSLPAHSPLCFPPSLPTLLYLRPVKTRRRKSLHFLCDKITQSCGWSQSH